MLAPLPSCRLLPHVRHVLVVGRLLLVQLPVLRRIAGRMVMGSGRCNLSRDVRHHLLLAESLLLVRCPEELRSELLKLQNLTFEVPRCGGGGGGCDGGGGGGDDCGGGGGGGGGAEG